MRAPDTMYGKPETLNDAMYSESMLVAAVNSITEQLRLHRIGENSMTDPTWETRARLARQISQGELMAVRAWIKHHPENPHNQTKLLSTVHSCVRIFRAMIERGVELTEAEREWVNGLESIYHVPKPTILAQPTPSLVTSDASEIVIARSYRDRASVEGAAYVGLKIFLVTREAPDFAALEYNERRAKLCPNDIAHARACMTLAKALAHLGLWDRVTEALSRVSTTQIGMCCKLWVELASEFHEARYLSKVREMIPTLEKDHAAWLLVKLYEISGNESDATQAKSALVTLADSEEVEEARVSNIRILLLAALAKHGQATEVKASLEQITEPRIKCKALASIAQQSGSRDDASILSSYMRSEAIVLGPNLIREILKAYIACQTIEPARKLAETLQGTMRCYAYSVIAQEGRSAIYTEKALRKARAALKDVVNSDPNASLARLELVRVLSKEGCIDEARQVAMQITTPQDLAEACLFIHAAKQKSASTSR